MTSGELITRTASELKGLATSFVPDDYTNALAIAIDETGIAVPVTDATKTYWISQRMKRHMLSFLMLENVTKFQVKQIHLEHKYKNLSDSITFMDKQWEKAQNELPLIDDPYKIFGVKIDAGFQYDNLGRDTTYSEDNLVIITPNEESVS
jgi:hypothetical protein